MNRKPGPFRQLLSSPYPRLAFALNLLATAAVRPGTPTDDPPPRVSLMDRIDYATHQRFDLRIDARQIPKDPARLSPLVEVEIELPSGERRVLPAFVHQPHQVLRKARQGKEADWIYPVGQARWEARFTPFEPGRHRVRARVRSGEEVLESDPLSLEAIAPAQPGFVGVQPTNPRMFGTSDGNPFFPLGLNLAFIGPSQYLDLEGFDRVLGKLAAHGGNFARIWTGCEDWALGIEARKSAWGRSWAWSPPFAPMGGQAGYHQSRLVLELDGNRPQGLNLSPTSPIALLATNRYRLSGRVRRASTRAPDQVASLRIDLGQRAPLAVVDVESRDSWQAFQAEFETEQDEWWLPNLSFRAPEGVKLHLDNLSLRTAEGGPELLGEANPNHPLRGRVNPVDCAMLDRMVESAERHGVRLQLCLLTRDHYRGDLAELQSPAYREAIRDAQSLLRYAVARWGHSPSVFAWEYFNEMDPNAPTTRFHEALGRSLSRFDPYGHLRTTSGWGPAPAHWTHPELDIADLHWYLRPAWGQLSRDAVAAVLDRAGLLREHAPERPRVLGEFGLADDRWGLSPSMRRDRKGIHIHNALWASAFSGLSAAASFWWWETFDQLDHYHHFEPLSQFLGMVSWADPQLEAVLSSTSEGSRALLLRTSKSVYGWIADPRATWWRQLEEEALPPLVESDRLEIEGLPPGDFVVTWWNTWQGSVIGKESIKAVGGQPLTLSPPDYTSDLAFVVEFAED